jgi:hypothetical protein
MNTIKKNTEALMDISKEVTLEVNTRKMMCMLMYCHHNAGQDHNINIANRSSENVAKFKYLRGGGMPWLWSASELYRPSDRRLLAK